MHPYSINSGSDKNIRTSVAVYLFVVSIVLSIILHVLFADILANCVAQLEATKINCIIQFLNLVDILPNIIGVSLVYGIITWLYNKYIWKINIIQKIHGVPNLNGSWEGSLISSFNNTSIPMEMIVEQNWNSISIIAKYPNTNSSSHSNTATIKLRDSRTTILSFGFHNQSTDVSTNMQEYDGYNILTINSDNTITAKYFNDRPNPNSNIRGGNKGTFTLNKVV